MFAAVCLVVHAELAAEPVFVALVQVLQVVDAHPRLLIPAALHHAVHARAWLSPQIDKAIWDQSLAHIHNGVKPAR